jgi:DNA-binding phage protein
MKPMSGRQAPSTISTLHREVLEEVRHQGATGYALAQKTGLPTSTMHRFLDGQGSPTLATVEAVAKALGLVIKVEKGND